MPPQWQPHYMGGPAYNPRAQHNSFSHQVQGQGYAPANQPQVSVSQSHQHLPVQQTHNLHSFSQNHQFYPPAHVSYQQPTYPSYRPFVQNQSLPLHQQNVPQPNVVNPPKPPLQQIHNQQSQPVRHRQDDMPPPKKKAKIQIEPTPKVVINLPPRSPPRQHPQPRAPQTTQPRTVISDESSKTQSRFEVDAMIPNSPSNMQASLLLSLADEYLAAARDLPHTRNEYHKLVVTALGCLEMVLLNVKLPPLREAQITLHYAQLLYNETDNLDDASTVLTKGIDVCERNKYFDLKYAMRLLLVQIFARTNKKAALRDLESLINDAHTYRHIAWEYALRFHYVLSFEELESKASYTELTTQLKAIMELAKRQRDNAVFAFAAALLALTYMKIPTADSIQLSQEALAGVRSLQLDPDVEHHPQTQVLVDMVDLSWSWNSVDEGALQSKRSRLERTVKEFGGARIWDAEGTVSLPVNVQSLAGISIQNSGLVCQSTAKTKPYIRLGWITREELHILHCLFDVGSISTKNHEMRGYSLVTAVTMRQPAVTEPDVVDNLSKSRRIDKSDRLSLLRMHRYAEILFMECATAASDSVESMSDWLHPLRVMSQNKSGICPGSFHSLVAYFDGSLAQGKGDLVAAAKHFTSTPLTPSELVSNPNSHLSSEQLTTLFLQYLALANLVLISRSSPHLCPNSTSQFTAFATGLLARSLPVYLKNLVITTFSLIKATRNPRGVNILQTKNELGTALTAAKASCNHQAIGMILTFMQDRFYKDGNVAARDGEQALKCARAASYQTTKRWGNSLWLAVSSKLEIDAIELAMSLVKPGEKIADRTWSQAIKDLDKRNTEFVSAWVKVSETVKRFMLEPNVRIQDVKDEVIKGEESEDELAT